MVRIKSTIVHPAHSIYAIIIFMEFHGITCICEYNNNVCASSAHSFPCRDPRYTTHRDVLRDGVAFMHMICALCSIPNACSRLSVLSIVRNVMQHYKGFLFLLLIFDECFIHIDLNIWIKSSMKWKFSREMERFHELNHELLYRFVCCF